MNAERTGRHVNLLLRSLSFSDLALISPHLTRVTLEDGEVVVEPGAKLTRVLFPEKLLITFREPHFSDNRAHVGIVGREGLAGWPLLLGSDHSPFLGLAQFHGGTALSVGAEPLIWACRASPSLNDKLLRFVHNFMVQMACTIVSNASDPNERRIARWLLMMHDRADEDLLPLTHDHVSAALNIRRASVTDCFHVLEGIGLIRCKRGKLIVRDRAGLQAVAAKSYGMAEAHYAQSLCPFGKQG